MPRIIIHSDVKAGQPMPVLLTINGEPTIELPLNQEVDVTDEQFVALAHSDHTIEITVEGETAAADEAEQAPAPAGSGDGGDAGGGGNSGEPAADTSTSDESELEPTPEAAETVSEPEAAAQPESEAPAAADETTLELDAPVVEAPAQDLEQPAPEAALVVDEQPVEAQPDAQPEAQPEAAPAAEETPLEKLQHAVDLEQEAIDELKQQGGDA
jgi:hypothetical protein